MTNQKKLQLELYKLLTANGIVCEIIEDGGCRLDVKIKLYYDDESRLNPIQKGFTSGIVAVFWNSKDDNHNVEYLGHRIEKFDGYEVSVGGWLPITLDNVIDVINNDIKTFKNHIDKHIERFGLPKK